MIGFAVALLVVGVILLILGVAVHAAHLLLWLGIVLAIIGLLWVLFSSRSGRGRGARI
jgi:membrane-bound ClpP family serine protease